MGTVRCKSYAKINLTLKITGEEKGYHTLDSVVASVDLYDLIVLKSRRDKLVSVTMHGCGSESIPFENNNAVRAAENFINEFGTCGADITVYKNIPMGLGLGGSSADSAGVLNGLARLYKINDTVKLKLLADGVGSDTRYMLGGGYARLFGRGDIVKRIESNLRLDILLLAPNGTVSTAECYKRFNAPFSNDCNGAEQAVANGDKSALAGCVCNDLTAPASILCKDVQTAIDELKEFDPLAVNMTGSGSGVYAIFENPEFCAYAKSRYRGKFRAIQVNTILPTPKNLNY
ncbi:MAG: 4-(cytidine 5'-diphospho)-2-C-methyl-D-erythritol kinase [Clostridia bacterium]|nr:4-(cytidine 5'-diphospho)-2-C-methyl-D-erythritol kinase [Clostridia bacterium]